MFILFQLFPAAWLLYCCCCCCYCFVPRVCPPVALCDSFHPGPVIRGLHFHYRRAHQKPHPSRVRHGGGGGNGRQHGGINIANEPSATIVNGSVLWCLDVVRPPARFDEFIFRHQVAMTRIRPATKARVSGHNCGGGTHTDQKKSERASKIKP